MSTEPGSKSVKPLGNSDLNDHGNGGQVTVARRGHEYYAYVGHMQDMGTTIVKVTDPRKPQVVSQIPAPEAHPPQSQVCGDAARQQQQLVVKGRRGSASSTSPTREPRRPFLPDCGKGVHHTGRL
jgi:hypothetical protein